MTLSDMIGVPYILSIAQFLHHKTNDLVWQYVIYILPL